MLSTFSGKARPVAEPDSSTGLELLDARFPKSSGTNVEFASFCCNWYFGPLSLRPDEFCELCDKIASGGTGELTGSEFLRVFHENLLVGRGTAKEFLWPHLPQRARERIAKVTSGPPH